MCRKPGSASSLQTDEKTRQGLRRYIRPDGRALRLGQHRGMLQRPHRHPTRRIRLPRLQLARTVAQRVLQQCPRDTRIGSNALPPQAKRLDRAVGTCHHSSRQQAQAPHGWRTRRATAGRPRTLPSPTNPTIPANATNPSNPTRPTSFSVSSKGKQEDQNKKHLITKYKNEKMKQTKTTQ